MRRLLLPLLLSASCGGGSTGSDVGVRMDFARTPQDYFTAPFPSEDVRAADGSLDLDAHPGPLNALLVGPALGLVNDKLRGFSTTAPVFFTFTGPVSHDFPTPDEALLAGATVQLIDLDAVPPAPRRVRIGWVTDGGTFGTVDMLSVSPIQGLPLEPGHRHALIIRRALGDAEGLPLARSETLRTLAAGGDVPGLRAGAATAYRDALGRLAALGIRERDLAGLSVFDTQDPMQDLEDFYAHARALPTPTPEAPFTLTDTFPEYCVYESTIRVPSYQEGTTPFANSGGGWVRDANGAPALQGQVLTKIFVTVPRQAMPAGGYPFVVHIRAGGGGRVSMAERGPHPTAGGAAVPGSGPARIYALAGYGGITIDGPAGGLRNPQGADEQFLVFNVNNPPALLDNVRQYALESALTAHVAAALTVDPATTCPGATTAGGGYRYDLAHAAIFGHSMGASVAPLAAAVEPALRGVILSGAGSSWIANVLYKTKPLPVRPFVAAQVMLSDLTEFDPGVAMLQWAGESADSQTYARALVHQPSSGAPRHVLMFQGLADHYIPPPVANALSLSGGFDLAGMGRESEVPELAVYESLASVLPWTGRSVVSYPVSGNVVVNGVPVTAAVSQHLEDGIEDGHEVFFQLEGPRHQAQCFLESLLTGTPRIVAPAALGTACN